RNVPRSAVLTISNSTRTRSCQPLLKFSITGRYSSLRYRSSGASVSLRAGGAEARKTADISTRAIAQHIGRFMESPFSGPHAGVRSVLQRISIGEEMHAYQRKDPCFASPHTPQRASDKHWPGLGQILFATLLGERQRRKSHKPHRKELISAESLEMRRECE